MPPTELLVRRFWELMATNDFASVVAVLAPEFTLEWPQSGERIRGPETFARMNAEYPAAGPWRFAIHRIVAGADQAVSDVGVTDGSVQGRAISFFAIDTARDLITKIVEFWPEPFPPAENRAHLVERMDA